MLRYIGSKYLEGQQDSIKEYNIGVEALGRPLDFDPKKDSIVRVEAVRLRQKLKQYYETEGLDHPVVISLQVGHYIPQFPHRNEEHGASASPLLSGGLLRPSGSGELSDSSSAAPQLDTPDRESPMTTADSNGTVATLPIHSPARNIKWRLALALIVAAMGVAILSVMRAARPKVGQAPPTATAAEPVGEKRTVTAAMDAGDGVRIICGYSKRDYVDLEGKTWGPDRYYTGGTAQVEPRVFIARTADHTLFETFRGGDFSYDIPLKAGVYELHLYFVETDYGPGTTRGGGEISRLFHIDLNGNRLLTDFDVFSDANGTNVADERVYKDVAPASDGQLHLKFAGGINTPILNALEVVPGLRGKMLPVRIVAQEHSYTDEEGRLWSSDRYFSSGRLASYVSPVEGTSDSGLYASYRFGHFDYAIPVAEGRYAVTLYFAETYFGAKNPGKVGVGARVFDVYCNGAARLRNFDILKEAGGDDRAVFRTFHDLRPNAQGKLLLSFIPVKNYASVRAIEVTDESR